MLPKRAQRFEQVLSRIDGECRCEFTRRLLRQNDES
jgi:hypothetical protein